MGLNKSGRSRKQLGVAATGGGKDEIDWENATLAFILKSNRLNYVLLFPGRLYAEDMFDLARMAEVYGSSEIRLTVEQNLIIPIS